MTLKSDLEPTRNHSPGDVDHGAGGEGRGALCACVFLERGGREPFESTWLIKSRILQRKNSCKLASGLKNKLSFS